MNKNHITILVSSLLLSMAYVASTFVQSVYNRYEIQAAGGGEHPVKAYKLDKKNGQVWIVYGSSIRKAEEQ